MDVDWYDLYTKVIGFVWWLIGLACVYVGIAYANDPTASDTFLLNPNVGVVLAYMRNIILLGGLSLAFLLDEVLQNRDSASVGGYTLFVIGSFVLLFGVLSLTEPESFLHPQLSYPVSLTISGLGIVCILLGMAFIFGLGIRMVVLSSLLILILVATVTILYMSQFILPRSAATVLGPLLVTAAAIYLLRGTDFEKAEKVAVVVLVMALALAGSTSFASFVLTPSYDNTTMVVGGSEPGCPGSQTLTFDEEKFNLENGALGNHTEKEAKEAILSELDIEAADSEKKHREIAKFYEKLRKPLDEMESNDTNRTEIDTFLNLNKSETRRLSDAFEDALVAEVTSYHYGQSNVRVERLPRSISTNETLRFIAEKYDIQNPEIADEKPRRIRFFERKIDVEERFNPDRYYVVEGTPEDSDYESTHLLIVREVFFFRNTRLVRFQVGDC